MNSQCIDLNSLIQPRPPGCRIPLTPSQARIWNGSLDRHGRRPSLRLCASAARIVGPLSLSLLRMSIEFVIRRHEALRIRFVLKGGRPYQQVGPAPVCVLSTVDLSDQLPGSEREISRLAQEFIDTPIDLAVGPLFEARIWRLTDNEHVLILLIDHIVSDGVSTGILTHEVWECYRQGMLGQPGPVSLPPIPVQFPDYAVWQANTYPTWMEKHAEYWKQHLRGISPTVIPAHQRLSDRKSATWTTKHISFGYELTAALRAAARRERSLLPVFILTAYAVVLSVWCRTEDLLVILSSHGRHRPVLRNVIGFVANMLYLRIHVKREQTFRELLAQVKGEVANALEHRDFDRVPDLLPQCSTEVSFNWQSTHSTWGALDHYAGLEGAPALSCYSEFGSNLDLKQLPKTNELRVLPFPARSPDNPQGAKFGPVIFDTPSDLQLIAGFDPTRLAPLTVERFGRSLLLVAKEICQHSSPCIASLLAKTDVD